MSAYCVYLIIALPACSSPTLVGPTRVGSTSTRTSASTRSRSASAITNTTLKTKRLLACSSLLCLRRSLLKLLHVWVAAKATGVTSLSLSFALVRLLVRVFLAIESTGSSNATRLVSCTVLLLHTVWIHVIGAVSAPLVEMVNTVAHAICLLSISCLVLVIVLPLVLTLVVVVMVIVLVVVVPSTVSSTSTVVILLVPSLVVSSSRMVGVVVRVRVLLGWLLLIRLSVASTLSHNLLVSKSSLYSTTKLGAISIPVTADSVRLTHLIRLLSVVEGWIVGHTCGHAWWDTRCWSAIRRRRSGTVGGQAYGRSTCA
mmetsp:Transcript_14637/g.26545  ORF Transcript_14637/g.26545 Transcript_14637/m.26545 type:complete len:314 (-) Transcript_14637:1391-2332(-)